MRYFVVFLATLVGAAQALEPLVGSSSFQLFLQPTFSQLTLKAQTIAAQSISSTVATVGDLRDAYVVIQDVTFQGQGPRLGASLQLPATTLTFAVFGSSSNDQNYLNTLILTTFSSEDGQAQLIRELKTKHALYKDLVDIRVWPITTFGQNSSEQEGFFQKLNPIEICLLVMGVLLLTGVAYMVIQSHRSTRQDHERVLQLVSSHAAAVSSLQALEQDDASSIASKFAYLKSFMVDKKQSHGDLNATPKATKDEEATDESSKDEVEMQVSSQESFHSAEHYPNSSSSYHSTQLLASSQEEWASSRSGGSSSKGSISEFDVIPSIPLENSELYLHSQSSFSASSHSDAYSSGMSSAHFSSSRWFQHNGFPTPSEDTFDVFQVDVDKFEAELLMDDESKSSRTILFMEHWVKQIQVVPSGKSSVATPDSAATPECASVHSGSQGKIEEQVTHQATPNHREVAETLSPVEV
jgi:hypothetical protein